MPSMPRGRDAATLLAVVLALVLVAAWLRSSDGAVPQVPVGLSIETLPATVPERPAPTGESPALAEDVAGERAGRDRTVRTARKRERRAKRGHAGWTTKAGGADRVGGQDPPATAPGPAAGSGGIGANDAGPPEFALE